MEINDSINLDSISPGTQTFLEEQSDEFHILPIEENLAKKECGSTRRRAMAEQSGGVKALPPKWQTKKEKEAILNDDTLKNLLGDQEILEIQKVKGGYLVLTENSQLKIDVNYQPRCTPGPALFTLDFGEIEPRK